jgi:hypothetical protein
MPKRELSVREAAAVRKAVALGLSIQHKFRAEPLYRQTGRGYMASVGVSELTKIKEAIVRGKNVAR